MENAADRAGSMREFVSLGLCSVVLATTTNAMAADWPQARHDERRTGASSEPLPPAVAVQWFADLGAPVSGEPVVSGCTLVVTTTDGRISAFNARNGNLLWQDSIPWAGAPPEDVSSSLAFTSGGRVAAGLPVDPAIAHLWKALLDLGIACEAYAVDNNTYPSGPQLGPDLVPVYLSGMPLNPMTGLYMTESDTPSPGNYRYEYVGGINRYLAAWWTDGLVLASPSPPSWDCTFDPAPPWPTSPVRGGLPTVFDAASGSILSRDTAGPATLQSFPFPVGTSTLWAYEETSSSNVKAGRVRLVANSGTVVWETRFDAPVRGGVASDSASGDLFVSLGSTDFASTINARVRLLATSAEAYAVDNNVYPPTGELDGVVTPIYVRCMPPNLYFDRKAVWSATPSPGDYYYEAFANAQQYRLWFWDRDGQPAGVFENGSFISLAVDKSPSLVCLSSAGAIRWSVPIVAVGADLGAPLLLPDGSIVVGTCTGEVVALAPLNGSERWRRNLGGSFTRLPSLEANGNILFTRDDDQRCVLYSPSYSSFGCGTVGAGDAAPMTPTSNGVLLSTSDGRLRAQTSSWGGLVWEIPLGGVGMKPLTTPPVLSNGWIYVVRSDGRLFALANAATSGAPPDPGPALRASKGSFGSVTLTWSGASLPAEPGGMHFHLLRRASPTGSAEQILLPHPSTALGFVDGTAGATEYYELVAADCGENES